MTKQFVTALTALVLSLPALSNHHEHEPTEGPCFKIKQACEAAGFEKGKHKEKKGLMKNCMKPLMHGETVAGVTIAAEDIAACKEKHDHKKEHRKGKHHKGKKDGASKEEAKNEG